MKEKELNRVLAEVRGQMQSTVISYPERDPHGFAWGSPGYNGNCSGKVPLGFMDKLGAECVTELFAGSGTLSDVCRDFNIPYCGVDLNPNPVRGDIYTMDILDISQNFPDGFYTDGLTMQFAHPPYPGINHVKYAGKCWKDPDGRLAARDIQNMTFEAGMHAVNFSLVRGWQTLPPGSFQVVLCGEIRSNGRYYSMANDLVKPGELFQTYVKLQHNTWSGRRSYGSNKNQRALTGHEMILVFRKPTGYEFAYVVPRNYSLDVRDSLNFSTWKDVVMAVLRNSGKSCSLDEIYSELEGHAKAKSNPHWKAKVRQTLQFLQKDGRADNAGRGMWAATA
ncbi:MAG: hypothetical protein LUE14_04025 [Clostridiales bacterium]|nr:hypothetical protein [Clostridiales bacterium]